MRSVDTIDETLRAILSSKFFPPEELKNDFGEILVGNPWANCYQRGNTGVCFTVKTSGTEFSQKDSLIALLSEALVANTGEWSSSKSIAYLDRDLLKRFENFIVLENSTLPSLHHQTTLEYLCNLYEIRGLREVEVFLNNNISLVNFLIKAYREIKKYFSEEKLFLEVVSDPETENGKELVIFINTSLSPSEAISKLDQFEDRWWLNVPFDVIRTLCIHLEFK